MPTDFEALTTVKQSRRKSSQSTKDPEKLGMSSKSSTSSSHKARTKNPTQAIIEESEEESEEEEELPEGEEAPKELIKRAECFYDEQYEEWYKNKKVWFIVEKNIEPSLDEELKNSEAFNNIGYGYTLKRGVLQGFVRRILLQCSKQIKVFK